MSAKIVETPLMKQYLEMKRKHPDAILLFRVGDFYETFSDDAVETSRILGITLTRRANGSAQHVELAGFPHHALDAYLPKLVRAGKRVAICEQLEDPKLTKKLVKRGITELITPGVNTRPGTLNPGENNFLAGVVFRQKKAALPPLVGVAFLDVTTGEFLCTEGSAEQVEKLLESIRPKEVLRMHGTRAVYENYIRYRSAVNELDDWVYTSDAARQRLQRHFGTATLKGFGVDSLEAAVIAAGSLLHYLDMTSTTNLGHITSLGRIDEGRFMSIDGFTLRNLEILDPIDPTGASLFKVLNRTLTPMGERMLRNWLTFPLVDISSITKREDAIEAFFRNPELRCRVTSLLPTAGDMTRLIGRLAQRKAAPREMIQLLKGAECAVALKELLGAVCTGAEASPAEDAIREIACGIPELGEVVRVISTTILPDPANDIKNGGFIAPGVSLELDQLRDLHKNARQTMENIRLQEVEKTGISSLKLIVSPTFGYMFEVTNTHAHKVPEHWARKQTLKAAERYVTPELRQMEERIFGAEERIKTLEEEVYNALLDRLLGSVPEMQKGSETLARVDCLLSFAVAAAEGGYVRPVVDDSHVLDITEGRHPVIEKMLPPGNPYVANSVRLDPEGTQIMMITGPNMSGKSALLRQTALIAIMAQAGSFVPASAARIGLVDKVFTRVGASDNLAVGESTFMVEMTEAASILNNMGDRSLVLFDELGRGTSTYDGISIAWAVVEHIHENGRCRPRTLFATHYHELNEMESSFPRIKNFSVSVKEIKGKVVFLRKLTPGGSEHSFGIHVARLAGMPPSTVKRAEEVLAELENASGRSHIDKAALKGLGERREGVQLSLFQLDDPLLSQIREELLDIDIDRLTPLEALTKLHDLQGLLRGR